MKSIHERLQIIYGRLAAAPAASTREEMWAQLNETIDAVEDEFSELAYAPTSWRVYRRIYGPQADSARDVAGWPKVIRYRHSQHNSFIGDNGSIEIQVAAAPGRSGEVVFSKRGSDEKGVWEQK